MSTSSEITFGESAQVERTGSCRAGLKSRDPVVEGQLCYRVGDTLLVCRPSYRGRSKERNM
eukprot:603121-Pyramimonas_sp.AAC.1